MAGLAAGFEGVVAGLDAGLVEGLVEGTETLLSFTLLPDAGFQSFRTGLPVDSLVAFVVFYHAKYATYSKEVRGCQEINMENMALNKFSINQDTVEQIKAESLRRI